MRNRGFPKPFFGGCNPLVSVDLVAQPELLLRYDVSALVAGAYWARRACNALADRDDLEGITRAINGGTNGLDDRRRLLGVARAALSPQPARVLLVPQGGGELVAWDGTAKYAGQDLVVLVPQLQQVYALPGGPWDYGGVLRVWRQQDGDLVLERSR